MAGFLRAIKGFGFFRRRNEIPGSLMEIQKRIHTIGDVGGDNFNKSEKLGDTHEGLGSGFIAKANPNQAETSDLKANSDVKEIPASDVKERVEIQTEIRVDNFNKSEKLGDTHGGSDALTVKKENKNSVVKMVSEKKKEKLVVKMVSENSVNSKKEKPVVKMVSENNKKEKSGGSNPSLTVKEEGKVGRHPCRKDGCTDSFATAKAEKEHFFKIHHRKDSYDSEEDNYHIPGATFTSRAKSRASKHWKK